MQPTGTPHVCLNIVHHLKLPLAANLEEILCKPSVVSQVPSFLAAYATEVTLARIVFNQMGREKDAKCPD